MEPPSVVPSIRQLHPPFGAGVPPDNPPPAPTSPVPELVADDEADDAPPLPVALVVPASAPPAPLLVVLELVVEEVVPPSAPPAPLLVVEELVVEELVPASAPPLPVVVPASVPASLLPASTAPPSSAPASPLPTRTSTARASARRAWCWIRVPGYGTRVSPGVDSAHVAIAMGLESTNGCSSATGASCGIQAPPRV